jgi:hypothetical protein
MKNTENEVSPGHNTARVVHIEHQHTQHGIDLHKNEPHFDEAHVLHELKHYLPSQTPLKDFIHHNSLHAFQKTSFYDGIFKASKIFGYQVTLPLAEYRELYRVGRIREDILEKRIIHKKGKLQLDWWKEKLISRRI